MKFDILVNYLSMRLGELCSNSGVIPRLDRVIPVSMLILTGCQIKSGMTYSYNTYLDSSNHRWNHAQEYLANIAKTIGRVVENSMIWRKEQQ